MKLTEILPESLVVAELQGVDKSAVLGELCEHVATAYPQIDATQLNAVLWERERLGSTAIGDGTAIPHGKLGGLSTVLAAFGRHRGGVDFQSLDGKPTRLIFVLVAPEDSVGQHLKALARVSRLLKDPGFRERLLAAPNREELYRIIREEDDKY
ncbi:PTS sugar transporter subunit IIA [Candidatus Binatia bacterium]|nr:PTS sugar transporter subunit IIA [Candidatus Binatia bacterium]